MNSTSEASAEKTRDYIAPDPKRLKRRLVTVPVLFVLTVILTAILPFLLAGALLADLIKRRPLPAFRTILCIWLFLLLELSFLLVSAWVWLKYIVLPTHKNKDYEFANRRIQKNFCRAYVPLVLWIFQAKLRVHGQEHLTSEKPAVIFTRHVSLIDTFLPVFVLFSLNQEKWPRYVLKSELLSDPLFDIVGNRFPNVFIHRGKGLRETETKRILSLRNTMAKNESLVIYPEGTRFTPKKRKRLVEHSLKKGQEDLYKFASSLKATLPPLTKGSMALLSESSSYDLVIMAHRGFENVVTMWDLFRGSLIGKTIDVMITKYPFTDIPKSETEKKSFLMNVWKGVDDFALGNTNAG